MRRVSGLFASTTALLVAAFLSCPLSAQRRSMPSPSPFPDEDAGLGLNRSHAFGISGVVADANSHLRIGGVRVDLQGATGSILATTFTNTAGDFQFNNVRSGTYELSFEQSGYLDEHQHLEIDGPVFGMSVQLRRLTDAGSARGASVSVREYSIPGKARDAMTKGMNLLYQKSDFPGSIKQFERAIQVYPDYYEAYAQMGIAYVKMKDPDAAEKALRKSVELSKEHYSDALYLLASLFSAQKRFEDAEPLARKAVEADPDSWRAQMALAQVLLGLNRADEAQKCAQDAITLAPDNPTLVLLLADVHIKQRNDRAVLEDLNNYLRLAPNGPYVEQARRQRDAIEQRLRNTQPPPASSQVNP